MSAKADKATKASPSFKAKMVPINKTTRATPIFLKPFAIATTFFVAGWLSSVIYYRPVASNISLANTEKPTLASNSPMSRRSVEAKPSRLDSGATPDSQHTPVNAGNTAGVSDHLSKSKAKHQSTRQGGVELSLDDIWMSNDSEAWQKASKKLLRRVRKLIQQGKTGSARELLDNLLRLDEKNIDALELSALIYKKQGQTLIALSEIYRARDVAMGSDREANMKQTARQWLADLASNLKQRGDEIGLLDLYKKAVELEPDYGRYYIYLGKLYLDLGNTYDAVNTLETARFDSSINVEIDNLLASIQKQKPLDLSDAIKIRLTQYGHQFYVRVRINGQYDTTWLLDTGASVSAISPQTLGSYPIDASEAGSAWFNTANGMVQSKTVLINGLDINDIHLDHLKVGVLDLSSQGRFDGLLGMDFLRQFNFYLDQGEKTLYLRRP